MSSVSLERLRALRGRAESLLRNVEGDLASFVKKDGTFRRLPDSPNIDDDVNVTTTCSCLMALALTNRFHGFYRDVSKYSVSMKLPAVEQEANKIFQAVINAPWMSSGLTVNNAFSTTLVLRAYGFLQEERLFSAWPGASPGTMGQPSKNWELFLGIEDAHGLALKIRDHTDAASEFLWLSVSDKTRHVLGKWRPGPLTKKESEDWEKTLLQTLSVDLRRILQSGWLYEPARFSKASDHTKTELNLKPTGYKLTQINRLLLVDEYPNEISAPSKRTLGDIATLMAGDISNFSINEYPPSSAVLYWFVDGVARGKIELGEDAWKVLCTWAAKEFNRNRSLVVAEHDAMMDPVAMGMSACLCARLRDIAGDETLGSSRENLAVLPSAVELEHAIEDLICQQTKSGIWPKYFPMFHYHDAGSNFCFTFELLEAVLYEFGKKRWRLLDMPVFIDGLEKAVTWCERNRLRSTEGTVSYAGWNSGGHIITLGKEQPESWATAVVHMFLYELTRVVSQRIQHHVLRKYGGRDPKPKKDKSAATLDGLLDMEVLLPGGTERLTPLLKKRIVDPFKSEDEITLRRKSIKIPRSALLFGPPGTSKTEVTKAIADDLQWPYVEIGPSEFLKGSLANIYLQADEIFRDLMDLSGVIVFFDEMDALVQTREGEVGPDITSQFLTTTMLPKLAHLHDHARVVFFMATNYQDRFDAAIKRAGRFDLLLCMWPPLLKEKLSRLHRIYGLDEANPQTRKAGELIEKYTTGYQKVQDTLSLLTFGEYRSFLNTIGTGENIGDAIESLGDEPLRKRVEEQSAYSTLKLAELEPLQTTDMKFNAIAELDGPGLTRQKLKDRKVPISPTLRYFCDRKESKEQH